MPRPKQDASIRDDTTRLDTALPNTLIRRIESIASFLGLTRRAAILVILNEGCLSYERTQDARKARDAEISE